MPDSPLAFATRINDAIGMPKITFDEESQISVALSRIATRASRSDFGARYRLRSSPRRRREMLHGRDLQRQGHVVIVRRRV
jgi:hypothetical protein